MQGLGAVIRQTFSNVTTHKTYDPVKSYQAYQGLKWISNSVHDIPSKLTFVDTIVTGKKFGFFHVPDGGQVLIKFMNETCDGYRVSKEVHVDDKWHVKVAGVVVNHLEVFQLPQEPTTQQELYHAFSCINALKICRGILTKDITSRQKRYVWEKDGCSKTYARAKNCKGFY